MTKVGVALALIAGAMVGAATAQVAQDRTYFQRFVEESLRKMPPVTMPPPTAAQLAARPTPAPMPLTMAEAKAALGLDRLGADVAARIPGGKLAIVDLGYRGLKQWLDAHSAEKALTTVFGAEGTAPFVKFVEDPGLRAGDQEDHGYWVYRVAREVLPDVPILLYPSAGDPTSAIIDGGTKGVVVFNVSLGVHSYCEIAGADEDPLSKHLRVSAVQREGFVFLAAGNARQSTHTWVSADTNANGYVDFRPASAALRDFNNDIDGARVALRPGHNQIWLSWDVLNAPTANYELELRTSKGSTTARIETPTPGRACLELEYETDAPTPGYVLVKRLAGPASGVTLRLNAEPNGWPGDFNGLQTGLIYTHRDNPFTLFVGSFGKAPDGKFAPSAFSDIGVRADGALVPHLLGPGQLIIDGEVHQGTSFAAPFLTALYATRVGYNLKNLVERSASLARVAADVPAFERSRWGVPDADKVTGSLTAVTGPTKVDGVSHRVDGGALVVTFGISRCCMEGLIWFADVTLLDPATRQPVRNARGSLLAATASIRVDEAGYQRNAVEVRFAPEQIAPLRGKQLELKFDVRVRAWQAPPPGSLLVDEAPVYRVTL